MPKQMKGNVKNQKARVKSNQVPEETSHQSPSQSNSHRTRKRVANMPVSRAMENQGTSDLLWDRPHPKHSSFRGSVFEPQSEQRLSIISIWLLLFLSQDYSLVWIWRRNLYLRAVNRPASITPTIAPHKAVAMP